MALSNEDIMLAVKSTLDADHEYGAKLGKAIENKNEDWIKTLIASAVERVVGFLGDAIWPLIKKIFRAIFL